MTHTYMDLIFNKSDNTEEVLNFMAVGCLDFHI